MIKIISFKHYLANTIQISIIIHPKLKIFQIKMILTNTRLQNCIFYLVNTIINIIPRLI